MSAANDRSRTKTPLHVLVVEDNSDDAELLMRELGRGPYDITWERVETPETMAEALDRKRWDIVVSDYAMPRFSAPAALALLQASGLEIPFMVVSGTVGEETAVHALKSGANDFMVKGKLARLLPAIDRELREGRVREARREAERALRTSELRFRRLAESGLVGIAVGEATGRLVEANDTFLKLVERTREELSSGTVRWTDLLSPDRETDAPHLRLPAASDPWETEYVLPSGGRVPAMIGAASLDGTQHIAISLNLTAQKSAEKALRSSEEQLRQAQKLEAIGTLAGGVAHDFNNLLSVILSYSEMLSGDLQPGDPMREDVLEIRDAGRRATELTRQLLAFSRQQILQPQIVELNQVVQGLEKMIRRLLGEEIELVVHASRGAGIIEVDPAQIEQVIVNLAVNARDAMQGGGTFTIETTFVVLNEGETLSGAEVKPGEYVRLTASDTGIGMSDETRARIFEPFYTTKETGKGTGLGLSTVFGIVKQSSGHIVVQSTLGVGTTFAIYLPHADNAAPTSVSRPLNVLNLHGTETILLLENDDPVRQLARMILTRHGYKVLVAESPGDALLVCEQHPAPIHLLLTDVVMPRMSGPQLADRVASLRPEMKVLYMSGHTLRAIADRGVLAPGVTFLQKPITPEPLLRRVREVLDTPA